MIARELHSVTVFIFLLQCVSGEYVPPYLVDSFLSDAFRAIRSDPFATRHKENGVKYTCLTDLYLDI